jgi:peroxiredoxin
VLHDAASIVGASFAPGNGSRHALVYFTLPDYLTDLYRETFKSDLSRITGGASWTVPMPGRYVIDTDGVVAYADVKPDYTRRPDPKRQLRVLSAMKNSLLTDRRQR